MNCEQECAVFNIFAIDGCPCQESMRVSNLEAYARGTQTNSKHENEREQVTGTGERGGSERATAGVEASGASQCGDGNSDALNPGRATERETK